MARKDRMKEIQASLAEPIDNYLRREYLEERRNSREIAQSLGVSNVSILNWLDYFNIPIRTNAEAQLVHLEGGRPKKRDLKKLYLSERKSTTQIAKN